MRATRRTIGRAAAEAIADNLQDIRNMIGGAPCDNQDVHKPGEGKCRACDAWHKLGATLEEFKRAAF